MRPMTAAMHRAQYETDQAVWNAVLGVSVDMGFGATFGTATFGR
jgi:hypothetical protein